MIALQIFLIFVFLASGGYFAGMETGVVSTNRLRLQHLLHRRVHGAQTLKYFLDHPDQLLGTTLVGTNLSHVSISVLSANVAARLFGQTGTVLAPVVMTLVILVFAEYLPKAFFQSNPSPRTLPVIGLLKTAGRVFYPVNCAVMFATGLLFPSPSSGEGESSAFITREELKSLAAEASSDGKLGRARRQMIERVFDLTLKTCRQIMIPVEHMVAVELTSPREEIIERARESGYSRMPVFEGSLNGIRGIVHILDVLGDSSGSSKTARDYMRPPSFVGADTPADELLARMQVTRQPMLIVRDESSNVLGLVTTEDVLEEIVGEL